MKYLRLSLLLPTYQRELEEKPLLPSVMARCGSKSTIPILKLEKGQTVSIEKGLFGAFFLSVEGLNKRLKVKRVK